VNKQNPTAQLGQNSIKNVNNNSTNNNTDQSIINRPVSSKPLPSIPQVKSLKDSDNSKGEKSEGSIEGPPKRTLDLNVTNLKRPSSTKKGE
jgi:hypothetical protein